jgi:hypothetical protein
MTVPRAADGGGMRHRTIALLLALVAVLAWAPSAGAAGRVWATVNACDPPSRPGSVGIRASMPPSRHHLRQWMRFRVEYFSDADQTWKLVTSGNVDSGWDRVGSGRKRVRTGYTFTFTPPAAGSRFLLRGRVDFQWRRGRKVKVRETRWTTEGHTVPGDPELATSLATCEIKR